jgi:hypothetical protein
MLQRNRFAFALVIGFAVVLLSSASARAEDVVTGLSLAKKMSQPVLAKVVAGQSADLACPPDDVLGASAAIQKKDRAKVTTDSWCEDSCIFNYNECNTTCDPAGNECWNCWLQFENCMAACPR